jgi:hypothetical protein
LPRVAESVIVNYCDFCAEQTLDTRAGAQCALCGQLVCRVHVIEVGFRVAAPQDAGSGTDYPDLVKALLEHGGFYAGERAVCVECAGAPLNDIVARLKQAATARSRL